MLLPTLRALVFLVPLGLSGPATEQNLVLGAAGFLGANVALAGVQTSVNTVRAADVDGTVTSATFGWSTPSCQAAVKIKFFRPDVAFGAVPSRYRFIAERGPFDVAPLCALCTPPVLTTVTLDPPVRVLAGDVVGITNVTSCGGPIYALSANIDDPRFFAFTVPGDAAGNIARPAQLQTVIWLEASGFTTALRLLDRFQVTLKARNPGTGAVSDGFPRFLTPKGNAGYFSIPDFTGDTYFPEVMVKMVDASAIPELGGTFWFFHASLTDVPYTVTVTDLKNRSVRTYSNSSGSGGQLCGQADTSAFPSP